MIRLEQTGTFQWCSDPVDVVLDSKDSMKMMTEKGTYILNRISETEFEGLCNGVKVTIYWAGSRIIIDW